MKKTFFSAYEPSPALTMDCSSGRTSLVMMSPAQFQEEDNTGNNDHSRHHILSSHSEGEEDEGERGAHFLYLINSSQIIIFLLFHFS